MNRIAPTSRTSSNVTLASAIALTTWFNRDAGSSSKWKGAVAGDRVPSDSRRTEYRSPVNGNVKRNVRVSTSVLSRKVPSVSDVY